MFNKWSPQPRCWCRGRKGSVGACLRKSAASSFIFLALRKRFLSPQHSFTSSTSSLYTVSSLWIINPFTTVSLVILEVQDPTHWGGSPFNLLGCQFLCDNGMKCRTKVQEPQPHIGVFILCGGESLVDYGREAISIPVCNHWDGILPLAQGWLWMSWGMVGLWPGT